MKSLIVGMGEVGHALFHVLDDAGHELEAVDPAQGHNSYRTGFYIMHVCFPYSDTFVETVKRYKEQYKPKYTVIHSTVPLGTSEQCLAVHSPIRGIHPNLEDGIRVFPKFLGGPQASNVADYFRRAGIKVVLFDDAATTEAMKLFDTEYYRTCIEFAQRVKTYCDVHNLNFHEVYTLANETYNEGYAALGHPEYIRPVLQPIMTKIGGHCVMPNKKLIELSES